MIQTMVMVTMVMMLMVMMRVVLAMSIGIRMVTDESCSVFGSRDGSRCSLLCSCGTTETPTRALRARLLTQMCRSR